MKRSVFSDEELHTLQRNTFNYFWKETNPRNGLLADNTSGDVPASIAAVGHALAAYAERIDDSHANAKRTWREMGEPEYLSAAEVERLREASRVWKEPLACEYVNDTLHLDITLPPQAVAAVTLEFINEPRGGGEH